MATAFYRSMLPPHGGGGSCPRTLGNDSADLLIAATALEHGLTVATRNVHHFEPTGVRVLDPS